MPLLGLYLQHKDGTNLLMHTKSNWNLKLAYQVAQDVATQLAQLRKEDFGPMGLRNAEPHFAAGRVVSLSFYQVAYELLTDVYVAVVQHVDDNPFYSDTMLQRAKTAISTVCRSERSTCEEIQKKHGEIWTALEAVLDHSRSDVQDDWASVERKSIEARDVLDSLFAIDFPIPTELLPEARPQMFGAVFGDVANKGTPKTTRRTTSPVSTSASGTNSKRRSSGSRHRDERAGGARKLRPASTASSATTDVNSGGMRKPAPRSTSSGAKESSRGHKSEKTSPRKSRGMSSKSSTSSQASADTTSKALSTNGVDQHHATTELGSLTTKSPLDTSESGSSATSAAHTAPLGSSGDNSGTSTGPIANLKLTPAGAASPGKLRLPSPLTSPLAERPPHQAGSLGEGGGLPPLPVFEEGDEIDSSGFSDSDSLSDSYARTINDDTDYDQDGGDVFESPRLDSPTDSDDEDDELASESLNDDSFTLGEDDGGRHHLRVQLSSHDRTYSSGVDSDLATTPRTESTL